ncbi:glucosaminidase domain-containing protein [Capnocytophaga canimorsus]|uniref:glucosaminidase domain-containing protein n=1 Tax=Capnocytophaga canimorsus TaxID=28188 RepID=UPI001EDDBA0C|nr:glucosaminidase domain-containing protein [Capnocytophaga canimorsus]GJQ05551.1 hemagglutinin [Capnocytophaga canimorsus]
MMKKFSFLLLGLLALSCSPRYYKKSKNPKKITQRNTQSKHILKSTSKIEKNHKNDDEDEYLVATSAVEVTPAVIRQYIETYKDISMVEMQRYKIPASITLAQAILESGSGQGRLARYGNNHFGIKCHLGWEGKTISHDDDEKGECFRRYKHPNESFEDHSIFIANRSRYAFLFELAPDDYKGWAYGLKKAGYATDPKYPQKLISLIHKYQLHQYDEQVLGIKKDNKQSPNSKAKYYIVKLGDTLYKISREQNISIERIIQLNNLTNNNIQAGQQLLLE